LFAASVYDPRNFFRSPDVMNTGVVVCERYTVV
jgi:hypothetical protein